MHFNKSKIYAQMVLLVVTAINVFADNGQIHKGNSSVKCVIVFTTSLPDSNLDVQATMAVNRLVSSDKEWIRLPVKRVGLHKYEVIIKDFKPRTRVLLTEINSNNILADWISVEPGDDIVIKADLDDPQSVHSFSGKGAAKYETAYRLSKLQGNYEGSWRGCLQFYDSIYSAGEFLVTAMQPRLTRTSATQLMTDFWSKCAYAALFTIAHMDSSSYALHEEDIISHLDKKEKLFPDSTKSQCIQYLNYRCERAILAISKTAAMPASLTAVCESIRNNFSGALKERLMANVLLMQYRFNVNMITTTGEEWTALARREYEDTRLKDVKERLLQRLQSSGNGGTPYDFYLPLDSSKQYLQFSSLKGKVVLIDMWAYSCTGCYLFANAFHQRIYPEFATDSNFVLLSLYLDQSTGSTPERAKMYYLKRLRGEDGPKYTFPDYLNVYGGKGQKSGQQTFDYYDIESFPRLMLIGKDGKIYSGILPFFIDKESPNVEKLRVLINQALRQ